MKLKSGSEFQTNRSNCTRKEISCGREHPKLAKAKMFLIREALKARWTPENLKNFSHFESVQTPRAYFLAFNLNSAMVENIVSNLHRNEKHANVNAIEKPHQINTACCDSALLPVWLIRFTILNVLLFVRFEDFIFINSICGRSESVSAFR